MTAENAVKKFVKDGAILATTGCKDIVLSKLEKEAVRDTRYKFLHKAVCISIHTSAINSIFLRKRLDY